ncbi:MAG: type I-C CRISPR-associated protein Cas7/Csd2 [Ruminiclostridium sp.]
MDAIKNRYEFIMLFDVENGNPNGDPDAGNMPRTDPETSLGIVTDVCLKRKIRNYVQLVPAEENAEKQNNILVLPDRALNSKFTDAYKELGLPLKQKGKNTSDVKAAKDYMCINYYDVRAFGAVMSTGDDPCGIVRGPVQLTFGKSIDPVFPQDITITRQARTTEDRQSTGETEMGKKSIVPYGLYRAEGFINANLAQSTGFDDNDLKLLWKAIVNMFEYDRSAARGKMSLRKLVIFKHASILGNAPASRLFDLVKVEKTTEVPRQYSDYTVTIDESGKPEGIEIKDGFEEAYKE